ncbi:hypothetical protein [Paenibacillus aquistagni]|uniref:Uncharacterized protein n=1 Tax=Paenibacillus aquistagni TaxID=1852522 RepID=A0A1X7LEV1_9BACL|nr:hypothetical protein [Paenibacillus aquistagni]SMG52210.1 hypothetical protein SAMN06295960_3365 [Paenibacillus aquistagni]
MSKSRREKWRNLSLNSSNIDEYLTDLIEDTKSQYITQGVSFNKDDSYQMGLLKQALLQHSSFSGLVKHLLTLYFQSSEDTTHVGSSHKVEAIQEKEDTEIAIEDELQGKKQIWIDLTDLKNN